MSQVLDNNTNDKVGQYGKKFLPNEIPEFVRIWTSDKSIGGKIKASLGLESKGARAFALLFQAFTEFEPTEQDKTEHAAASMILLDLDKTDADLVLLEKLALAKGADAKLAILRGQEKYLSDIAAQRATAQNTINKATMGAQLASQVAFQQGMQFGELRNGNTASGSSGNKNESLRVGVYEATLGKQIFRFCWESRSCWYAYHVAEGLASEIASYDKLAPQIDNPKRTPFCSSPTRARKICKAWLAYQGFRGEEAVVAAFMAVERPFDALSAGNPTERNWHMVSDTPTIWKQALDKGKGKLPTETITATATE